MKADGAESGFADDAAGTGTKRGRRWVVVIGLVLLASCGAVAWTIWRPMSAIERRLVGDWRYVNDDGDWLYDERYTADQRFQMRMAGQEEFFDTGASWRISGQMLVFRMDRSTGMWWPLFTGALKHGYIRAPGEMGRQRVEFQSDDQVVMYPDPDDLSYHSRGVRVLPNEGAVPRLDPESFDN